MPGENKVRFRLPEQARDDRGRGHRHRLMAVANSCKMATNISIHRDINLPAFINVCVTYYNMQVSILVGLSFMRLCMLSIASRTTAAQYADTVERFQRKINSKEKGVGSQDHSSFTSLEFVTDDSSSCMTLRIACSALVSLSSSGK